MKQQWKKLICACLALIMTLSAFPIPHVQAAELPEITQAEVISQTAAESLFADGFDGGNADNRWSVVGLDSMNIITEPGNDTNHVWNLIGKDADPSPAGRIEVGNSAWTNYTVSYRFKLQGWNEDGAVAWDSFTTMLHMGGTEGSDRLEFAYRKNADGDKGRYDLKSKVGEERTVIATADGTALSEGWHTMEVSMDGAAYTMKVDDNVIFTGTLPEGNHSTYGGFGIDSVNANLLIDDVLVTPAGETPETTVTLDQTALTLSVGQEQQLTATVNPEATVEWKSSDEKVATVSADGLVQAVQPGTASITATANGVSASCTVTVEGETECSTFYYVAPNGSDSNPGTEEQPFATIQKARDTIRALKKDGDLPSGGITVYLRGGEYYQSEPIEFLPEDSGTASAPIVYASYPGEEAVITSGAEITGWVAADEDLPYTAENAKGNIYVADIEPGWRPHDLYQDGERLQVSQQVNSNYYLDWTKLPESNQGYYPKNPETYGRMDPVKGTKTDFQDGVLDGLPSNGDIEINMMLNVFWNGLVVVEDINTEENYAYVRTKNTLYNLQDKVLDWNGASRYNIMNAYRYLDEPGEWCVDSENGKIYFWPEDVGDLTTSTFVAPKAYELIRFQGDNSDDDWTDADLVSYITLKDLTVEYTDRIPEDQFPDEWIMRNVENPDAAIYLEGVSHCSVQDTVVQHTGAYAIAFNQYAQNNQVVGCRLVDMGCGGVQIYGYGPGTLDVSKNNLIERNYISDTGLAPYVHSLAVNIFASNNNVIRQNYIENVGYAAISIIGCDPTSAGGGTGRSWHDSFGTTGTQFRVRQDEIEAVMDKVDPNWSWGQDIERYTTKQFLHNGDNLVEYNIIMDYLMNSSDGGGLYAWGTDLGNVFQYNVIHKSQPKKHFQDADIYMDNEADGATLRGNMVWVPSPYLALNGTSPVQEGNEFNNYPGPKPSQYDALINTITSEVESKGGWLAYPMSGADVVLTSPADKDTLETLDPVTLRWGKVDGAHDYDVEVALDADFSTVLARATVSDTEYTFADLEYGRPYYWRVTAYGELQSNVVSETRCFYAPNTPMQDLLLPVNAFVDAGGAVALTAAVPEGAVCWIAPKDTTEFTEGETMTKAESGATTITAPTAKGVYKLYLVEDGIASTASQANIYVDTTLPGVSDEDILLWVSADEGVTTDDSGKVSKWESKFGGAVATQNNAANQPQLRQIDGENVVAFDGGQSMNLNLGENVSINGQEQMTIIVMGTTTVDDSTFRVEKPAVYFPEGGSWGAVYVTPKKGQVQFRFGTGASESDLSYSRTENVTENDVTMTAVVKDGTTEFAYVDGQLIGQASDRRAAINNTNSTGFLGVGVNNTYFQGALSDVLIIRDALTAEEIAAVYELLNAGGGAYDDVAAVTAAKSAAESATYGPTSQSDVSTEEAAAAHVKTIAEKAINNADVKVDVITKAYTPASDGTEGSYVFTLRLSKGSATLETAPCTMKITGEPGQVGNCDLDEDGKIDLLDVLTAMKFFGAKQEDSDWSQAQIADVDGNGQVELNDLVTIVLHFT